MGWASKHIEKLQAGEPVSFRPRGNSMSGLIESGDFVKVVPVDKTWPLRVGDIVLCRVKGREYLHLVKDLNGDQVEFGNYRGRINGLTSLGQCFGRVVQVIF